MKKHQELWIALGIGLIFLILFMNAILNEYERNVPPAQRTATYGAEQYFLEETAIQELDK
jgi:hypothetical protein